MTQAAESVTAALGEQQSVEAPRIEHTAGESLTTTATLDPTNTSPELLRKREAKLARLQALAEQRSSQQQSTEGSGSSVQDELAKSEYTQLKDELNKLLESPRATSSSASASVTSASDSVNSAPVNTLTVGEWTTQCLALLTAIKTWLAVHNHQLSPYDQRSANVEWQRLNDQFKDIEAKIAPKRKFGFRGDRSKPSVAPPTTTQPSALSSVSAAQSAPAPVAETESDAQPTTHGLTITDRSHSVIIIPPAQSTSVDIALTALTN